jgi:hypothetical protein
MKNASHSRKGILSFNFIAMIPRIIFLAVMLIACVVLIRLFLNSKFDTKDITAEVLINGMVYGSGGVSYYDPLTGRNHPMIVDISQFDEKELNSSFYYPDNNLIAAKMTLSTESDPLKNGLKTVYYNREWYDNWYPLLRLSIGGIGGVRKYEKTLPIIYRDSSGELHSGYMHYQVVQPRG